MGKVLNIGWLHILRDNPKYESIKYGSDEAARSPLGMAVTDGETGKEDIKLEHVTCYNNIIVEHVLQGEQLGGKKAAMQYYHDRWSYVSWSLQLEDWFTWLIHCSKAGVLIFLCYWKQVGEDPDALAQEQTKGCRGEGGAEEIPIEGLFCWMAEYAAHKWKTVIAVPLGWVAY